MKTILSIIPLIIALLALPACDKDNDETPQIQCDDTVIASANNYLNAPDDHLNIISVVIIGDCLAINFGSSGCDGSTWDLKLIDAGVISKSLPPQRNLRLSLQNNEVCDAYFTKEVSYNISSLKVSGTKSVRLTIKGWDEPVLYEY
ncbi:hypothetical protein [Carboxylicivirga marina]|uniref:Lipoprotein n=1 Tax=Carboxylicivirga marina TaxID=2800988 RepID=A0ABS1HPW6_9BACT|nr:hypothetical protein [Carboxylicivirga marina]MBK3519199.1 hypothetical protein [Carboxylicivirga marina]